MSETHAPRPIDLVALVTFDEEVRENQAVTRDSLGGPPPAPRPLSAAIEQWLHRGRQTWITMRGRQVQGIATAREMSARSAWQIDALIDAATDDQGEEGGSAVLLDLLRQAVLTAEQAKVTRILLRTRIDAPAAHEALRAGFVRAIDERLWHGHVWPARSPGAEGLEVREPRDDEQFSLFQLYGRAMPIESRQALAMTLEEWQAVRERRWCARGQELTAFAEGRAVGSVRYVVSDDEVQLDLVVEPESPLVADVLLEAARERLPDGVPALALVPRSAAAVEEALRARGFEPAEEYVLLARRIARPVRELAPARARVIPTRG